jgi:hypothetical protein
LELPFLGAVPMFAELRINSDAGQPLKNFEGNAELAKSLQAIVGNLAGEVSKRNLSGPAPTLEIV